MRYYLYFLFALFAATTANISHATEKILPAKEQRMDFLLSEISNYSVDIAQKIHPKGSSWRYDENEAKVVLEGIERLKKIIDKDWKTLQKKDKNGFLREKLEMAHRAAWRIARTLYQKTKSNIIKEKVLSKWNESLKEETRSRISQIASLDSSDIMDESNTFIGKTIWDILKKTRDPGTIQNITSLVYLRDKPHEYQKLREKLQSFDQKQAEGDRLANIIGPAFTYKNFNERYKDFNERVKKDPSRRQRSIGPVAVAPHPTLAIDVERGRSCPWPKRRGKNLTENGIERPE